MFLTVVLGFTLQKLERATPLVLILSFKLYTFVTLTYYNTMLKLTEIPQIVRCFYRVDVSLSSVEDHIERYQKYGLDMNPDFQRGHVWDEQKQIKFVEYIFKGGQSGREIYFNHPGWQTDYKGDFVLVDGKQRIESVRKFIRNELPIFGGHFYKDIPDARIACGRAGLVFNVASIKTRAEVLRWYIDFNDGGVVHAPEEIARVKELLDAEYETIRRTK